MSRISPLIAVGALLLAGLTSIPAQSFALGKTQVEISVVPGFDHTPLRVSVVPISPDFDISQLSVSSDSEWVTATRDVAAGKIVLRFDTSDLVNSNYTATITTAFGQDEISLFVGATVNALNVFKLKDDPVRSRTYGIQLNGQETGGVVMIEPRTGTLIANVGVGRKPTDIALSRDASELFVINAVDESISVISLPELVVTETLDLPTFENYSADLTTANIAVGTGPYLYYIDGAWGPTLHVYDRSSQTTKQSVNIGTRGFGDIGISEDGSMLFGWIQYGWNAGWSGSYIASYSVAADGTLTWRQSTDSASPTVLGRRPLESPILQSDDSGKLFVKQLVVDPANITTTLQSLPDPVYSITPGGELAATESAIYDTESGDKLYDLPQKFPVQTITSDYSRLVYFDAATRKIETVKLIEAVAQQILQRDIQPSNGAIILPPAALNWTPVPGVASYQIYLGTNMNDVAEADPTSGEFLGQTATSSFSLNPQTVPHTRRYYWRVDSMLAGEVVTGSVHSFDATELASDASVIDVATIAGHRNLRATFSIESDVAGDTWEIRADNEWISFGEAAGTTPSQIELILDASGLDPGDHTASVTVSNNNGDQFTLPVKLHVAELNVTHLESADHTIYTYGISEDSSGAYLFELNTITEELVRVIPVGESVTDLALHWSDQRIYLPNWSKNLLLAFDLATFELERTYAFPMGVISGAYRVTAAGRGKLVVEEANQWIDIGLMDTDSGTMVSRVSATRQGDGAATAFGGFYYHGEDGTSSATVQRYEIDGNTMVWRNEANISPITHYGSSQIVVSRAGNHRVFWNGMVYDSELRGEWAIGEHIYALSADGRYAFGEARVFDVDNQSVLPTTLPPSKMKSYNSVSETLVSFNGSGIDFLQPLRETKSSPANGATVASPSWLGWSPFPVAATYRVYLGRSPNTVATAPEYFIESPSNIVVLDSTLTIGTWYWRIDAVTEYGVIEGEVTQFTVSPILPDKSEIHEVTFPHRVASASVALTSSTTGLEWSVTTDADWVEFAATSGTTPDTITMQFNTGLDTGIFEADITVKSRSLTLFNIPVRIEVNPLHITHLESDPVSARVYAISEDASVAGNPAFLLEIDTETQTITRTIPVGRTVTDLAVHAEDNRVYVPNWESGSLLAIGMDSFEVEQTYPFAPANSAGFVEKDIYRVTAGRLGRLVVQGEKDPDEVALLDTTSGGILSHGQTHEGGGDMAHSGRYYYHGDSGTNIERIHKIDLQDDQFASVADAQVTSAGLDGSPIVVVSQQGNRVFWNGTVFDHDLNEEWEIGESIYSTTPDGSLAFAENAVYDVVIREAVLGMPLPTTVSAYNSTTSKLIVPHGEKLGFYHLQTPLVMAGPDLSIGEVTKDSIELNWMDNTLEQSFTLQYRPLGATAWFTDELIPGNSVSIVADQLESETQYEFRLKAEGLNISSEWSSVVVATTLKAPPATPIMFPLVALSSAVTLVWSNVDEENGYVIERREAPSGNWDVLTEVGIDISRHVDTTVSHGYTYSYRVRAINEAGESENSNISSVTVPLPNPLSAPKAEASTIHATRVRIAWEPVLHATSIVIERSEASRWIVLGSVPVATGFFEDEGLLAETVYNYRIKAINGSVESDYAHVTIATWSQYAEWLYENFGTSESGDMFEVDEYGVSLAFRFAFNLGGTNMPVEYVPGASDRGMPAIWYDRNQEQLMVEFVRRRPESDPGVSYSVEITDDLLTWLELDTPTSTHQLDHLWERVRYVDDIEGISDSHRFSRVRVTVANP